MAMAVDDLMQLRLGVGVVVRVARLGLGLLNIYRVRENVVQGEGGIRFDACGGVWWGYCGLFL